MREVIEVTDNENQVHVFNTFTDLVDYVNTCSSMGWLPDGYTWKITGLEQPEPK